MCKPRKPITAVVLCLAAAMLLACSKADRDAPGHEPAPITTEGTVTPVPGSGAGGVSDTSVPHADTVVTAAPSSSGALAGRSNGTMTRSQESSAMPLPGQNNDHSSPLTPAKAASSP